MFASANSRLEFEKARVSFVQDRRHLNLVVLWESEDEHGSVVAVGIHGMTPSPENRLMMS
jgi:hypothetical protein